MANAKNDEQSWTTAYEGSANRLVFDTPGDQWTGIYEGNTVIHNEKTGEDYDYAQFRSLENNELYQISLGYALRNGLETVPPGSLTRLTYLRDIDTSNGKQAPMKDIKVEYQTVS